MGANETIEMKVLKHMDFSQEIRHDLEERQDRQVHGFVESLDKVIKSYNKVTTNNFRN